MKECKHCKEKIAKNAKKCPKCGGKQPSILKWIIIGFFVLVILIGVVGGNNDDDSSKEERTGTTIAEKKEKLTLEDGYKGYKGNYDIGYYIEGYVKNNTSKEYSYVQITFNLYDKDGTLIGTAMDNVNNLEANGKWKFKAASLTTSDETTQIASYKLKEITGF